MLSTPVLQTSLSSCVHGSLGNQCPSDLLKQLEALVGTLENSFSSSEHMLSSSPASPTALANLKAEKDNRQRLLHQLTLVYPFQPLSKERIMRLVSASGERAKTSVSSAEADSSMNVITAKHSENNTSQDEDTGSAEWKYNTLVRLRKFLRRQYRAKKNKAVDSLSKSNSSGEDMADERAQLQQLASDIKSIEFEIRMLSTNKTAVDGKHSATDYADCKVGNGSALGDSARSQRDTVKRMLGSGGSLGGSSLRGTSASRMPASSASRLAGLNEGDEGDNAQDTGDHFRGVRRNLLELYADPRQEQEKENEHAEVARMSESIVDAVARDSAVDALVDAVAVPHPNVSHLASQLGTSALEKVSGNLKCVNTCIEAIESIGAKVPSAEASTFALPPATSAEAGSKEQETCSSPCKLARLSRQLESSDHRSEGHQKETNTSPCKLARLYRQLEVSDVVERESNCSPCKIERMRRQMAVEIRRADSNVLKQGAANAPASQAAPQTSRGSTGQAVPVALLDCGSEKMRSDVASEKMRSDVASGREAWSDVDLARWAAVNRGSICPSPVSVPPCRVGMSPVSVPAPTRDTARVIPHRPIHLQPQCRQGKAHLRDDAAMLPPLPTASTAARKRLETMNADGEMVEALAAKKISVLADNDATRQASLVAATPAASIAVGFSVGSDGEDSSLALGHSRVEETISSQDISTAGEEALLRTIKKILNGPGSTPGARSGTSDILPGYSSPKVKNIHELSLECLAALRSSAFLEGVDEGEAENETKMMLGDGNSGEDGGDDACGQARLESRGDSDDLGAGDVSDLLLHSVYASGSLAAAGSLPDNSLIEGTSLLEDFEALPVDRTVENLQLFHYVFTATPVGEPSAPVQKALVSEFDKVHREQEAAPKVDAPISFSSTPLGVPSGPVAKSLVEMFDQCLSPSPIKDGPPASSPGQAAREEGAPSLHSVVKRLTFPSEADPPQKKMVCDAYSSTVPESTMAPKGHKLNTASSLGSSRPMSAVVTRSAKAALKSRPMSALDGRKPATRHGAELADAVTATRQTATLTPGSGKNSGDNSSGGLQGKRTTTTMAWPLPHSERHASHQDLETCSNASDTAVSLAGAVAAESGAAGGGLFSAARAQAREARDGQVNSLQRDVQPSVRLAPPVRSPKETRGATSPLALYGSCAGTIGSGAANGAGGGSRHRGSSRPPSAALSRAASASPNRHMFGNIGLVAAKETLSSQQPVLAATTGAGLAASGWLPQQQRCLPPTTSIPLSNNNTKASCGAGGGGMATSAASGAVVSGRTPQVMLNNKMDLMASVRLARRTMADGKMNQNTMSLGPRRLPLQEAASLTKTTSTTVASTLHELRAINCLPNTRTAHSEDSLSVGASGLQIGGSGMNLGQVGGKRVLAPRVTGNGVTSKQPARLPPRAAVVSLDDVDVTAHRDMSEHPIRSPPERQGELPSLPQPDRSSAAAAGGLSSELMQLLREAAAERLANYRV